MTDIEQLIVDRLESIETKLNELWDFKSKAMGVVIAISGIGTTLGSIILTVTNHYWK